MNFKPLVLATLLATSLPGAAGAFSMRCDEPNTLWSSRHASQLGRDFLAQRRSGLPEWIKELRGQRYEHLAPHLSRSERPAMPDRVRQRREHISRPRHPQPPNWVQARRNARPTPGSAYGLPRFGRATTAPRQAAPTLEPGAVPNPALSRQFGVARFPGWASPTWAGPGWGAPRWRGPAWAAPAWGVPGIGHRHPWPMRPPVAAAPDDAVEPTDKLVKVKLEVAPEPAPTPASVDADRDGVANPADLCPDSAAGARVDAFGCELNAAIVLRGVNFKTDSAELTGESLAILDGVSATLVANPGIRVEVAGHTDSDGDDAYNKDLSQRRSESVVAYLIGKGVKAENMSARGYGEEQPVAGNDTADGKALNRRVELNRM